MAGVHRHSDEATAAAYNDTAAYPRIEDLAVALGYKQTRHFRTRIANLRREKPELFTVDRSKYRPTKQPVPGRFLVTTKRHVDRWLLTAAQDETAIDEPFWRNLHRYAEHIGAEVMVGGFTYNKALFEDHAARTGVFNSAVQPYLIHDDRMLGPLLFAAKMNILPTATRPLSGLDGYSRGAWAVYPHAKVQLVSVPSLPGRHPAMIMTTGCCTVPNYIEKKAGLKAEFHHQIGATIVEVDDQGRIFCRQIGASSDGSFQDLDVVVRDGAILTGQRIEQATWGDIHIPKLDPVIARTIWGYDIETGEISGAGLFHDLRPRHQAFHDLLDFSARNHHRRADPHFNVAMTAAGKDRVEDEVKQVARFLRATAADWSTSVVVASNHNDALVRWLREADPRLDAVNARYWCELNAEFMRRLEEGDREFDIISWAIKRASAEPLDDIVFVPRNGSYLVCQAAGGIETALHGDEGPNGARGSALNMNRMAMRLNIGHAHTASIIDGVMTSGLCGLMDQGYNSGPSSWSHTQTLTYASAKRTLVTIIDGKYRA